MDTLYKNKTGHMLCTMRAALKNLLSIATKRDEYDRVTCERNKKNRKCNEYDALIL